MKKEKKFGQQPKYKYIQQYMARKSSLKIQKMRENEELIVLIHKPTNWIKSISI